MSKVRLLLNRVREDPRWLEARTGLVTALLPLIAVFGDHPALWYAVFTAVVASYFVIRHAEALPELRADMQGPVFVAFAAWVTWILSLI